MSSQFQPDGRQYSIHKGRPLVMQELDLESLLSEVDLAILHKVITPRDDIHELANWYAAISDFAVSEIEARMGIALCREFMPEIREAGWTLAIIWPQFMASRLHSGLRFRLDFLVTCDGRRIGVECDGKAFHSSPSQMARDDFRSLKIREKGGLRFVRFTGTEIYQEAELCAGRVRLELGR